MSAEIQYNGIKYEELVATIRSLETNYGPSKPFAWTNVELNDDILKLMRRKLAAVKYRRRYLSRGFFMARRANGKRS